MLDDYDDKPDWQLWEDETIPRYLIRVASQVVWQAGELIDRAAVLRDNVWLLSDWLLNTVYPPQPPVDIDLGMHGSPEDPT